MARKSAAALNIVPRTRDKLIEPPGDLSEREQALWREVVATKPAEWFGADSAPVLKEYVRAVTMCDALAAKISAALEDKDTDAGTVKMLLDLRDKESRRAVSLATKMRLTQQSRYGARSADRADSRANGKRPWQS